MQSNFHVMEATSVEILSQLCKYTVLHLGRGIVVIRQSIGLIVCLYEVQCRF